MRKIFIFLLLIPVFLFIPKIVHADSSLEYKSFMSQITINEDTSVTVKESIKVDFISPHHGIFREIPGNIKVLSVTNENGDNYKYTITGSPKKIKIGDPQKTLTGHQLYIITYLVKDILKEFPDHDEFYWNVTGSNWDSSLPIPNALVVSRFAKITQIKCFAGTLGARAENCRGNFSGNAASFKSLENTGVGTDFTIVVGFDKNNNLIFPGTLEKIKNFLTDHWTYLLTPLPFLVPFYFWFKKGRDQRYISDNIYYEPDDKRIKTVALFERKFLPLVYSPIKSLTPAQIGTLIDQRVDINDVVAEITELARLGYLKIKRIAKKGILGKNDYEFTKTKDDLTKLADYQIEIMNGLFGKSSRVLMSSLKNKFYKSLKDIKDKLYENMKTNNFFDGNPEKVRQKWLLILFLLVSGGIYFMVVNDFFGIVLVVIFGLLGFIFVRAMPRRTPHGYALFRQIEGLKWYIGKGKWREEIAEKNLFIDEILPIAISLGVVKEISKDMKDLGIKPPEYVSGIYSGNFATSLGNFQGSLGKSLASAPSSSSGFSSGGGFSGGGGGGGGGGGW